MSRVLILGSGASHGARSSLEINKRPPLGKELAEYLLVWIEANDISRDRAFDWFERSQLGGTMPPRDLLTDSEFLANLTAFLRRAHEVGDFESEMAKFVASGGARAFASFNRLLAFAMLAGRGCRFSACHGGDLYDDLLRFNGYPQQKLMVITFNYDILLEEAAARVVGASDPLEILSYPGLSLTNGSAGHSLSIFKPHGSVSWFAVDNHRRGSATESAIHTRPARFTGTLRGLATDEEYVPLGGREGSVRYLKRLPGPQPVLAFYMGGKFVPRNEPSIERHRRMCLEALRQEPTLPVTIIGLRPPHRDGNDDFLEELFALIGDRSAPSLYVSPDPDECTVATNLVPRSGNAIRVEADGNSLALAYV